MVRLYRAVCRNARKAVRIALEGLPPSMIASGILCTFLVGGAMGLHWLAATNSGDQAMVACIEESAGYALPSAIGIAALGALLLRPAAWALQAFNTRWPRSRDTWPEKFAAK